MSWFLFCIVSLLVFFQRATQCDLEKAHAQVEQCHRERSLVDTRCHSYFDELIVFLT